MFTTMITSTTEIPFRNQKELDMLRQEALRQMSVKYRLNPQSVLLTKNGRPSPHVETVINAIEAALLEVEKPDGVSMDCHITFTRLRPDEYPDIIRDCNRTGQVYRVSILFYPQDASKRSVFPEEECKKMIPCAEGVCGSLNAKLEGTDPLRIRDGCYLRHLASLYAAAFNMGVLVDGHRIKLWKVRIPEDFPWFQRRYGTGPDYNGLLDPEYVFFIQNGKYRSRKIEARMNALFDNPDALQAAHEARIANYNARRDVPGGRLLDEE